MRTEGSRPSRGDGAYSLMMLLAILALLAQEAATAPGEVVLEDPTYTAVGLEWRIAGDSNGNCRVEVEYRKGGEPGWRKALPLLRVENREHPTYKVHPGNLLAGSVLGLDPGTRYEVKLTLADPDGGKAEKVVEARTRAEPSLPKDLRERAVPVGGLAEALASAKPGELLLLAPGIHGGPFVLRASGVVLRGAADGSTVLDGGGAKEVLNLRETENVVLEDLTVRNGRGGLIADGCRSLAVRRCRVERTTYFGISAQKGRGNLFEENVLVGPVKWEEEGWHASSYGLFVNGTGHVVRHNRITDWWDGISLASEDRGLVTSGVDLHGNDISRCTDDGIECDYVRHNIRIRDNRISNTLKGVSCQPAFGGPVYILRNEIVNARSSPYKFHVSPSGLVVMHNTSVSAADGFSGGDWRNAVFRNNLILGARRALDTSGERVDLDWNGWSGPAGFGRLTRERFDTLEAFAKATGFEKHGRAVGPEVFERLGPLPPGSTGTDGKGYGKSVGPADHDLRLRKGSAAVDAGAEVPNVNDGFAGAAPDLGCRESGRPDPVYGPRP